MVQIPIELAGLEISAHSSNTCLGGQVDFAVCVWIDIGADIPAFHDDVSKPDDFSLVVKQQIADTAHDGQLGCQVGNLGRPEHMLRDFFIVVQHNLLWTAENGRYVNFSGVDALFNFRLQRLACFGVKAVRLHLGPDGKCPIKCAGIHIVKIVFFSKGFRRGSLSGAGGSVDADEIAFHHCCVSLLVVSPVFCGFLQELAHSVNAFSHDFLRVFVSVMEIIIQRIAENVKGMMYRLFDFQRRDGAGSLVAGDFEWVTGDDVHFTTNVLGQSDAAHFVNAANSCQHMSSIPSVSTSISVFPYNSE